MFIFRFNKWYEEDLLFVFIMNLFLVLLDQMNVSIIKLKNWEIGMGLSPRKCWIIKGGNSFHSASHQPTLSCLFSSSSSELHLLLRLLTSEWLFFTSPDDLLCVLLLLTKESVSVPSVLLWNGGAVASVFLSAGSTGCIMAGLPGCSPSAASVWLSPGWCSLPGLRGKWLLLQPQKGREPSPWWDLKTLPHVADLVKKA